MMEPVFGFRPNQPVQWFSRALAESNQYCPYCGVLVGAGSQVQSDKEHLIGRNFVPSGSLGSTDFNFIFRACVECNRRKGEAERHVSTVTLLTSPARADDSSLNDLALHKAARDFHPAYQSTLVQDASLKWNLRSRFAGAEMTFGLIGPPQLDPWCVELVACNQIQALFTLIASRDPRKTESTNLLAAAQVHLLGWFPFRDWGNKRAVAATDRTAGWPILARIESAGGHFKLIARQRDGEHGEDGEWFWALEWNRSVRVLGAVWFEDQTAPFLEDIPEHEWIQLSSTTRMREEIPLDPENDSLFRAS